MILKAGIAVCLALLVASNARSADDVPLDHWAFRLPEQVSLPIESANPIDAFVQSKHRELNLIVAAEASPERLLRRVHLDLTGFPPTREALHAFLKAPTSENYDHVVQQLLASPAYGERWGRHWMDVWRYSDWYGRRRQNDVRNSHSEIWRWRDWIVRSLNEDKGYDRMIAEMLAADEIAPEDEENQAALGFIVRNWFSLNYNPWMQDMVEHTGKAFLGLRLNCVLCHDGKYNPITQADYFAFRAFFEPVELRQDRVPGGGNVDKFVRYVAGSNSSLKPIGVSLPRVFDFELEAETFMYKLGDIRDLFEDQPAVAPNIPKMFGSVANDIAMIDLPETAWYPGLREWIRAEELANHEAAVTDAANEWEKKAAVAELAALKAKLRADKARSNAELAREAARLEWLASDLRTEADVAAAKTKVDQADEKQKGAAKKALTAAEAARKKRIAITNPPDDYTPLTPQYPKRSTGRRTALAKWIGSEQNPLTARVAVNHIWTRHFGEPLVETVNDFGKGGAEPLNQQLLDWLSVDLMKSGWSMKRLHQRIVTSATYRMSSATNEANLDIDADNHFLWRFPPRRLEAEAIRDSILAAADRLDPEIGGPPLDPKLEAESTRRSLYFEVYPEDGGLTPFLAAFDGPDAMDCYRRTDSIVPQQALAMTNSDITHLSSEKLAKDLANLDDAAFLLTAYERILTRAPTQLEQSACREYLGLPDSTRAGLIRALFSHDDFVMLK